ncbi:FtsL-like putative cell division protein [Pedobacter sp. MR2016-24]|uniref:FtsL-like putative cell division protein n=1 Tax=Pedobacter sp. MR2016-24 TaxID=2994466 RepID=UPI002245B31C|nr:FtsL-like putative cell division protein [Pedobacter sp. MR2016-24]MCX2484067.1 FtsL-like putative cell division protein [Pedobacter sp. MR2016-24]
MNNQFREDIEEEEEELLDEPVIKLKKPKKERETENANLFFKKLFVDGVVSKEAATEMLPFLVFLSLLTMLYIANSHMAVKNIRDIDKLNKEVKELSWEYKSLKADLMFKSKLTEVAKKVDTLGIKELTEPPRKIIISSDEH